MILKVISTGSIGNAYLLENDEEALLLECGVKSDLIKQALDFNVDKVAGCIVSHSHGDHAKSISDVIDMGINTYASKDTFKALGVKSHRAKSIKNLSINKIGGFTVMPFSGKHDVPCFGFIIKHKEIGNTLFLTDSYYSPYRFANLTNIIVEANYSKEIIDEKVHAGGTMSFVRNRVLESHMSLENCLDLFDANDISKVNNIVLIHLSATNSNEVVFKETVENHTQKTVTIANNGDTINFNKTPF